MRIRLLVFTLLFPLAAAAENRRVVIFGPVDIVRQAGQPSTRRFDVVPPPVARAPFELVIQNGTSDEDRATSGEVTLNGQRVVAPSRFQSKVGIIREPVVLQASNQLTVTLQGKPGSRILVSVEASVDGDHVITEATVVVGASSSATVIDLPGAASLEIPAGAFDDATEVQLAALSSEGFDYLAASDLPAFQPLSAPKVRVKTSRRPLLPLPLTLRGLSLSAVPTERDVVFAGVFETGGEEGEEVTSVAVIGGTACEDDTAVCVDILPGLMSATNPLDPLDPVITVAAGTWPAPGSSLALWQLSDVAPGGTTLDVSPNDIVTASGRFELRKNFSLVPPLGSIVVTSHFYRNDGKTLHGAVDLHAETGTPVYAAHDGAATTGFGVYQKTPPDPGFLCSSGIRVFGSYGNFVLLKHSPSLATRYAHLEPLTIASGTQVQAAQPIATSDHTGKSCKPHLDFEMIWEGHRIDPEPLLLNDLSGYVTDAAHPTTLQFKAEGIPLTAPLDVTSIDVSYSTPLTLTALQAGRRYRLSLKVRGARLGGEHSVRSWQLRIGYRLSIARAGTGGGTVSSLQSGIACGSSCTAIFDPPSAVALTAQPDATSRFVRWDGDCAGTAATTSVTMTGDRTCQAVFDRINPASISGNALFFPRRCPPSGPCVVPAVGREVCLWTDNGDGIFDEQDLASQRCTITDSQGEFTFTPLDPGNYWIKVFDPALFLNVLVLVPVGPGQNVGGFTIAFGGG